MKKIIFVLTILLALPLSCLAMDLDQAKAQGYVGETPSGYLEALPGAPADAGALVRDINNKRREEYQKIARKNGTDIKAVEQLAGKKAIEKTPPGFHYKAGGSWKRK